MILSFLALSLSVYIVARVMPTVRVDGFVTGIGVALVYGILKYLLTWILVLVSLPFIILTLGLFYIVINAFLLWLTDKLIDGFEISGFMSTIVAAVFISVLDVVFRWAIGAG